MRSIFLCLLFAITNVFGDEQVRQVQEELRKRNLYFGDIDGQARPELTNALRRYQARKGFGVTGMISDETAGSLNVQTRRVTNEKATALPDVPVLRSDAARELPPQQQAALEQQAEKNPDVLPTPPAPAEAPPATPEIDSERIQSLIREYLRDGEGEDIATQTKYFDYPIEYFDHGSVSADFVRNDVANYVKRWPQRKYALLEPVSCSAAGKDGEMLVQFLISFQVRNKKHEATGRTMNFWTLRTEGRDLKIIAIREQRLHR